MVPHVCEYIKTIIHMYTARCVNMGAFPKLSENKALRRIKETF